MYDTPLKLLSCYVMANTARHKDMNLPQKEVLIKLIVVFSSKTINFAERKDFKH